MGLVELQPLHVRESSKGSLPARITPADSRSLFPEPAVTEVFQLIRPLRPDAVPTPRIVSYMIAYLDPGTVSMVLAAVAGGMAGIAVLFRLYWHRLLGLFSGKHREAAKNLLATQKSDEKDD